LPVYERGRLLFIKPGQATICVPSNLETLGLLRESLLAVLGVVPPGGQNAGDADRLHTMLQALCRARPRGLNIPKFLRAAFDRSMPSQLLPGMVVQYGVGKRGRWLDSTFTDETALIGGNLARQKHIAAPILRLAGVPVPDHVMVPTVDAAVEAAATIGYPVVVKPADQDGGTGVSSGLASADEVREAYERARQHSRHVLVERHFDGKDYRVIVLHDEVVWAHERVPGGVVGDGRRSVAELLDALNADPARADGPDVPLMRLLLDDEAAALLRKAGLDAGSVPADGQFVRLRRTSSLRHAGTTVPAFEQMHPDNRRLAVRAAQALKLDLAGVDLLIPDIARSWHESGAAICDVNGQPGTRQITAIDLPALILGRLVPGDGRIPTVLVLGAASDKLVRDIEWQLARSGTIMGCHDTTGVRVNGETLMRGAVTPYAAGRALALDRSVGAIVLSIGEDSVMRTGLPVARFDMLVLAGAQVSVPGQAAPVLRTTLETMLMMLLPACDGQVLVIDGAGLTLDGFATMTPARWQPVRGDGDSIVAAVLDGVRLAETRHGMAHPPH
jgi:cyanophycin synthetase